MCELLEDPHRIVGGEHGHGAREPDLLGHGGDRRQCRGWGGDEVVGTVVLSDREELQAELVGEFGFLEEIVHPLLGADAWVQVGEGDESEIHQSFITKVAHASIGGCARKYSPAGLLQGSLRRE